MRDAVGVSKDWMYVLANEVLSEIEAKIECLVEQEREMESIDPLALELPLARQFMRTLRRELTDGSGVVIVNRLPVDSYDDKTSNMVVWLLGGLLAPMVDQKISGTRAYYVRDEGRKLKQGVRRSITNLDQPAHTDGPWLANTPEFIGLACIEQSRTGGESRVWNLRAIDNRLKSNAQRVRQRLLRPFYWNCQNEHKAGDNGWSVHPVLWENAGRTLFRWYADYIETGYALAGVDLDREGRLAVGVMQDLLDDVGFQTEFRLEPGQILYINNREFAHARNAFEPHSRRRLVRSWHLTEGALTLEG